MTFANVRALSKKYKNIGMIHIDCHADCAPQGLCGFKYDNGAHIRRIMELGCLKGKNYTLIGPRGYWPGPNCTNGWPTRIFNGLRCLMWRN